MCQRMWNAGGVEGIHPDRNRQAIACLLAVALALKGSGHPHLVCPTAHEVSVPAPLHNSGLPHHGADTGKISSGAPMMSVTISHDKQDSLPDKSAQVKITRTAPTHGICWRSDGSHTGSDTTTRHRHATDQEELTCWQDLELKLPVSIGLRRRSTSECCLGLPEHTLDRTIGLREAGSLEVLAPNAPQALAQRELAGTMLAKGLADAATIGQVTIPLTRRMAAPNVRLGWQVQLGLRLINVSG